MLILALDTCDSRGSVALLRDGQLLQLQVHNSPEDYSSWLLSTVNRVLAAVGATLVDLSAYAIATGPGSFTGVRVGLTTVKAWSEIFHQPIAAVSRLEALAAYSAAKTPYVAVFADAKRGQLFAALYRRDADGDKLSRIDDELVTTPADFLRWVSSTAGDNRVEWISPDPKILTATAQWPDRLARAETIQVVSGTLAPVVGRLGYRLATEHRTVDALTLDANYVRRSDAEILWKGASR